MLKRFLRILNVLIIIFGCFSIYLYIDDRNIIDQLFSYYTEEHSLIVKNEYGSNIEKNYFQQINDFTPQDRNDLLNIYYTVISSNSTPFTFYCRKTYSSCIEDVKNIMSDNSSLSHINNFVHPFNSYKTVKTTYTSVGKITINITKLYSEEEINLINNKIDELYPSLVSSNKSTTENIKSIHDYIINHVKYDTAYVEGNSTHKANTAYGALFEEYAVCSGYSDLMSIFLNKMGISNYKISNDKHVWNLVYLDGEWLHLDLTFDDPISNIGVNHLTHDYFLVSTNRLKQLDQRENSNAHIFNEEIYSKK